MQNNIGFKQEKPNEALPTNQLSVSEDAGLKLLTELIATNIVNLILKNEEYKGATRKLFEG